MPFYERKQIGLIPLGRKKELSPGHTLSVSSYSWRHRRWDTRQAKLHQNDQIRLGSGDSSTTLSRRRINMAHLRIVPERHRGPATYNQPLLIWRPARNR